MSEEATQDTGSQEVPVAFLDTLPEEIRGEPSLRNFTDAGQMAKSYVSAQRMIGADKVAIPSQSATPDEWRELYHKLGSPREASGYEFSKSDIEINDDTVNGLRAAALDAGLSKSQAETMMGFIRNTVGDIQTNYEAQGKELREESEHTLRNEYGRAFEQKVGLAQQAATRYLGSLDIFEEVQLADGRLLGDHPDIIKLFVQLGEEIGEDILEGEPTEMVMTPDDASRKIAEMMRPDGPYFDKMHPEHEFYVQEVGRLFEYK
tara:strand:+ start:1936 stop:2721 length:786 start_codon:yes stop_codon:yes gene_type:complete